jgi:hypothetical protein
MSIEPTNISSPVPTITGQMGLVVHALAALRQDPKAPPLDRLKPGQLHRRVEDLLRQEGFHSREIPSRSTFDRFRRQFGPAFGIR